MDDFKESGRVANLLRYRQLPLWLTAALDRCQMALRFKVRYPLADQDNLLSCDPLFIISAGRSGTTLLRSMLVAGGDIAIPLESDYIQVAIRRFVTNQRLGWPDLSRFIVSLFVSHHHFHLWNTNPVELMQSVPSLPMPERSLARLIDLVFVAYQQQNFPEAAMWGDQSPLNTFYLSWIVRTFPNAKFLHLIRDGRDTVASMVRTHPHIRDLDEAMKRWEVSVRAAHGLARKLPSGQFLEVRYEDLVCEPENVMQRIGQFCGIPYKRLMLDYWKLPTTVEHKVSKYHENLGKPLFTDSIGRWRQRLSESEAQIVSKRLGLLLRECGYGDQ